MSQKLVRTYPHMYSRKPGNYNGIIIFEIDIMKKSCPIELESFSNLTFSKTMGWHGCCMITTKNTADCFIFDYHAIQQIPCYAY